MNFQNRLIIAVDFDGTIVEDAYPDIGKPTIFAFETLKRFKEDGQRLILWTYRYGTRLEEAVSFCRQNGVEFYAVNSSFPEEVFDDTKSRKIHADLFIDDRNVGGALGWGEIYQIVTNETPDHRKLKPRKGFLGWFK
jgi:hydroxymethylpyrimidine pyrophosphatase-like HAD family hydrolase